MKSLITFQGVGLVLEEHEILKDISFTIDPGQFLVVTGVSASGKTTLGKIIGGHLRPSSGHLSYHLPDHAIRLFVPQQHNFRCLFPSRSYYQQRFDHNYSADFPGVTDVLEKARTKNPALSEETFLEIIRLLNIEHLLQSKLIEISNGEGKRVQLAYALLQNPKVLVLDNPFVGLDKASRNILHQLVATLLQREIILVVITTPDEIPAVATHVLELKKGTVKQLNSRELFLQEHPMKMLSPVILSKEETEYFNHRATADFTVAVEMNNVGVRYGDKKVLENISWKISRGDKWALLGQNGSGKSTLLSLINGDNPQAYTNEIYLFDRKRGSGESIWEIKDKIGYISPELHIYFQRDVSHIEAVDMNSAPLDAVSFSMSRMTCAEAICSGFQDQIGSSNKVTYLQMQEVKRWMKLLQIDYLQNQTFYSASLGEQRLVLLARALVKNPPLLILDEPCQGLDKIQTAYFLAIVDAVCVALNKTLIFVSHYAEEIPSCVDQYFYLENGKMKV